MSENRRPLLDPDERVFTWEDVVLLASRLKWRVAKVALLAALLTMAYLVAKPPKYTIVATFKEGVEKGSGQESAMQAFLGGMGGASQPQTVALMRSHGVLRPLVERFGLQVSVESPSSLPWKVARRLRNHWRAEWGAPLPDIDWFSFAEVRYDSEEKGIQYQLVFADERHFELQDESGQRIASGAVGVPVSVEEASFTCTKVPKTLLFGWKYALQINPWLGPLYALQESLTIVPQKLSKSIYHLSLEWRDRRLGTALLNGLMEEYRAYLKSEYQATASEQMAYLEQRQEQVYGNMGQLFDEHAAYLTQSIGEGGCIALKEESQLYAALQQQQQARSLAIEHELACLKEERPLIASLGNSPLVELFARVHTEVQKLTQERDVLDIALQRREQEPHQIVAHLEELAAVRKELGAETPACSWAREADTGDVADYLGHHRHLLAVREKMLQERLMHPGKMPQELEGLQLETARELQVECVSQLAETEAALGRYAHLREQLRQPGADLASLAGVLQDAFSQTVIAAAGKIALQWKEEKYRTAKEGDRWQEELAFQKRVMDEHLKQLVQIEELNRGLIREKIAALQQARLECIHPQIAILQQELHDAVQMRIEALGREKELQKETVKRLQEMASHFPAKWKQEGWLELKKDMGKKIMGVMTDLVESKTISNHLHHIESKPLDLAIAPLFADHPHFLRSSGIASVGAASLFFFFALLYHLFQGFPLTAKKLIALQYPFAGLLSPFCDGPAVELVSGPDLETLRQVALFIDRHPSAKVIALLGGRGPDYSFALAENLGRLGRRIALLRSDFPTHIQPDERPGLLQYLQGQLAEPPWRQGPGFQWISSGGFSTFGVELLHSSRFEALLQSVRASHDLTLLWLRAPLETAENGVALRLADLAIATVSGEQTEQLTPLMKWAYHAESCRLTLIST